jgi:predicted small metal-binding protein
MSRLIRCECGYVAHGDTEDELVAAAERHIQADHPDLIGRLSREDLLAMVEEE